jgi:exopolysaccharide production protein ExoZ
VDFWRIESKPRCAQPLLAQRLTGNFEAFRFHKQTFMPQIAAQPNRKLQGLQVLRGVAALLVVWHHLKYSLGVSSAKVSEIAVLATNLGAIGVDIFFVVSGFVIAMTASRLGRDWRSFLASRIARIVPLYFTLSTFMLLRGAGAHFFLHGQGWPEFHSIFNSYFFIPLLDTDSFTSPLCANGWTLSFEMWFYLGFGLLITRAGGNLAGRIFPALMLCGVALTTFFYSSENWFLPKFLFHPLTLEFSAGCLLFHVRNWLGKISFILMCLLASVFLFFASRHEQLGLHMQVLTSSTLGFERAGIWGGFAVCLVGIVTQLDLKTPFAWPKLPLLLGDASYSIYLITPIVLTPTAMLVHSLKHFHFLAADVPTEIISGFFYLAGTLIGGVLLWKYFEFPATQWAKKNLRRFTAKANAPEN